MFFCVFHIKLLILYHIFAFSSMFDCKSSGFTCGVGAKGENGENGRARRKDAMLCGVNVKEGGCGKKMG